MTIRSLRHAVLLLLAAGVLLPARAARAGKKEDLLQADVDEIQRQVYDLKRMVEKQSEDMARILELLDGSAEARKERAQFNANVEALRGDLRSLSGRFDDTAARLAEVERKVTACARAALPSALAEAPPPADAGLESPAREDAEGAESPGSSADPAARFKQAHSDYVRDNLDLAIDEFRAFVRAHPEHENAPAAHYFIAMSYLKQHRNDEAVREIDELLARYPRAANAPDAMFRKGEALLQLNRMGQAVLVFNDVVSRYPGTPAATQASERLRELAAEPR